MPEVTLRFFAADGNDDGADEREEADEEDARSAAEAFASKTF